MVTVHECGFELLSKLPYSPAYMLVCFTGFPSVQIFKGVTVGYFEDNESVIMAINEWAVDQDQTFFLEGVKALQQRRKSVLISEEIMFDRQ